MKRAFLFAGVLSLSLAIISWTQRDREEAVPELTMENLWCTINETGIKHPEFVFAQAILETGHFNSKVCKENNNLFGMKHPAIRQTTAIGKSKYNYAIYANWVESVKDYAMFQDYLFRKGEYSKRKYLNYLDRNYCESRGYTTKLNKIIKSNHAIFQL